MDRRTIALGLGIAAMAACSGQSDGQSGVPRNSPLEPGIVNVPATTGRANLPLSQPPFTVTRVASFAQPFAIAFLPDDPGYPPEDQALLVTEKAGVLKMRGGARDIAIVAGTPKVATGGQGGLLDVAIAPDFAKSKTIYLTYSEAGEGGRGLALARATLQVTYDECMVGPCTIERASLKDLAVIWRSGSNGAGGQFGANILFSPDGQYLFLSSGERQRFTPAQDPKQALGKILRLTLDGKAAPRNPWFDKGGVEAMTWSTGHRNPYGMAFAPDGRLWEEEMGPRGGDELNLILPGRNYGWPIVSNGDNYSGQPIPDHPSKPEYEAPKLWWNPSVSPGGMILYTGAMFPQLKGSLLICTMSEAGLMHVLLAGDQAKASHFWDFGARLRDIAQAPDGAIWLLEDEGDLVRLTPKT